MNNDLISREALKKAIEEQRKPKAYSEADERQNIIIDCILYIIDNAPTVEERPQGEWKQVSSYAVNAYISTERDPQSA